MTNGRLMLMRLALTALTVSTAGIAAEVTDTEWQVLASIEQTAERHIAAASRDGTARRVVRADALDARLKLPVCADDLAARVPYGNARGARVTVEVSCTGPRAWRIYVPVRVETYGTIVVAARALPRDTILTAADLATDERALGPVARGHLADPGEAVGHKLRRAVPAGAPLVPALLASPPLVERGQLVTLQAASGGISVAMTGTALEDGARGAVIDVENGSSGRRVQAIVRSRRVVEVLLE